MSPSVPSAAASSPPAARPRRALPLARALPLLTSAVVVAALATALATIAVTLTRSELAATQDRLDRAVKQLATVSATAIRQGGARYAAATHDSALRRTLARSTAGAAVTEGELAAARAVLARLQLPNDSGMPIELWNAAGRRVAFVGTDLRPAPRPVARGELRDVGAAIPPREGLDTIVAVDSLQLGRLYESGGRVHFWIAVPVLDGAQPLGYLVQQRRIARSPQTERTLRELSGDSVSGYYHNDDRRFWTTIGGVPATPPAKDQAPASGGPRSRAGLGPLVFSEAPIPGSPFVLAMEVPRRSVVAGPLAIVRRLAALSVLLTLAGAIAAWLLGRRLTRPLVGLTGAAEAVAAGDYGARAPVAGADEVARLAASFNHMAEQVGASHVALEQREASLRALADAIPQLAWMAHPDGTPFWFNQRWYAYTGLTPDGMGTVDWSRVHDPAFLPEMVERRRSSIRSGEPYEMEHPLRGADGTYRWFLTRIEPLRDRDGQVIRWFGTSTDVQALREAREAAEAASRAKSDFLATMSHELRTPLNAIGGYAELLEMGLRGPVTDAQRRDLERIRVSQQHLLGLISAVLDLSRIERGRVSYDPVTVAVDPMLAGLDALVAPQAAAKQLTLVHEPCPAELAVVADREKLRQVLLNLLSNAIRYTPSGGRITLDAAAGDDETVAIRVRDTGPGIPVERWEEIFEPFVQLDRSLTQSREGVGLGLAISRDLARGMGGELRVESRPGEGSCFVLTLPRGHGVDAAALMRSGETAAVRA